MSDWRVQPEALYGFGDMPRLVGVAGLSQALKQGVEHLLAHGFRRGFGAKARLSRSACDTPVFGPLSPAGGRAVAAG